jgi:hypothetical protein
MQITTDEISVGQRIRVHKDTHTDEGTIVANIDGTLHFESDPIEIENDGLKFVTRKKYKLANTNWSYSSDDVRASLLFRKWKEVKDFRNKLEEDGCETPYGIFKADPKSVNRLLMAERAGIDLEWTLKDNTSVNLTKPKIKAVLVCIMRFLDANNTIAQQIRREIDNADDLSNIDVRNRWIFYSKSIT